MSGKYNMNVNKRVKELRKKNGYTQSQMAELLGKKISTYSQMERTGKIPIHIIVQLSEILKVEVTDILGVEDKEANVSEVTEAANPLIFDSVNSGAINLNAPPTILFEPVEERLTLTNREENAIIMLRNLSVADREEIYRQIKIFHDKKFKKR